MISISTLEDCARLNGLDASGLARRRPEPTLREIRIAAQHLRTPAGVWMPRAWVEEFITLAAIREEGGTGWQDFGEMATDYNRLAYGASAGTGWWKSGWTEWDADKNPGIPPDPQPAGEAFFSIPKVTYSIPGGPPLPPAMSMQELSAKIEAQYRAAVENMAKTMGAAMANMMGSFFGSKIDVRPAQADGLKAEDFNMPPFQFGWSGFKEASGGIGVGGAYITRPFYLTPEAAEMARLERQGFGIEVIKEEKTGE